MNIDDLKNIIEPVITRNNCFLWGIEILRGKKKNTLRVFIDSNNNNNVDINDCESISRDLNYEPQINLNLDEDYILEVSTPGVDRKFFDIKQLKEYVGQELNIKTKSIYDGKRKFIGKLIESDDSKLTIVESDNSEEIIFKFSDIDLCRLKPDYNNLFKEYSYGE
jgi:ribosome maturation factor RimP